MRSPLYNHALSLLGVEVDRWESSRVRLAGIPAQPGGDPRNTTGAHIVANLEREHQLSPNPGAPDGKLYARFLGRLTEEDWSTSKEASARYDKLCDDHALQAPIINSTPFRLYRYINGPGLLRSIVEQLRRLGSIDTDYLAQDVGRLLRGEDYDGAIRYVTHPRAWSKVPRGNVLLAPRRAAFVTFDGGAPGINRRSPAVMHGALALHFPRKQCFLALAFDRRSDDELRFPTVAEAGWFRWFVSSPHGEPHGWTAPHNPRLPRQPEAVMPTPTLERIDREDLVLLR